MQIRLAPQARADLDSIWSYLVEEAGEATATRLLGSIAKRFRILSRFPYVGKSLETELRPGVRAFAAGNYLIFYTPKSEEIRILRVLHASRNAYAVFTQELRG